MKHLRSIGIFLVTAILSASAAAQVSNTEGTATICVQPKLSVVKIADADWGKVVPPATGIATYLLDYRTGRVSCQSGGGFAFGDGHRGEFLVSGAPGAPIAYSVNMTMLGGEGMTIVSTVVNGNLERGDDQIGADGTYSIKIGGALQLTSSAAMDSHSLIVTVTVNYN